MSWQERITISPDVLVGKPIIKGTRIQNPGAGVSGVNDRGCTPRT